MSLVDSTSSNKTSQRFVWCDAKLICENRWSNPGSALMSLAVRCVWFLLKTCPYVTVEPVLLRLAILSRYVNWRQCCPLNLCVHFHSHRSCGTIVLLLRVFTMSLGIHFVEDQCHARHVWGCSNFLRLVVARSEMLRFFSFFGKEVNVSQLEIILLRFFWGYKDESS